MASPKKSFFGIPWTTCVLMLGTGYLALDILVIEGPFYHHLRRASSGTPDGFETGANVDPSAFPATYGIHPDTWAATVNAEPITHREVLRAIDEGLLRSGLDSSRTELAPASRRREYIAALGRLVDDRLVATYQRFKPEPVPEGPANAAYNAFVAQFPSREQFEGRLAQQNLTEEALRHQIEHDVALQVWLEAKLAPGLVVTDEEVASEYERLGTGLNLPERRRASHAFLTAHDAEKPNREAEADALLARALAGESIDKLADEVSDDPRTQGRGGDLGYMSRDELPAPFADALFSIPDPSSPPQLIRSELGWHILQLTDIQPPRRPTLEEAAPEVRATLLNGRRAKALRLLVRDLRARAKILYNPAVVPEA